MANASRRTAVRHADDFADFFGVSRETTARLEVYAGLLARWQPTINLVAPRTVDDVWQRHFADSAQVVDMALEALGLAPDDAARRFSRERPLHWLDFGSGGGFPGLVAGLVLADRVGCGCRLTLVDSDQRKVAFLREVARRTGLSRLITVDIVVGRIESPANRTKVGAVDVVSARAVSALSQLLAWSGPYFGRDTVGVFLKGRDVGLELAAVAGDPGWVLDTRPSRVDADGSVVVVRRSGGADPR